MRSCNLKFYRCSRIWINDDDFDMKETDDGYENFYGDKNLFNFSDYPKDLRFYDPVNKKVLAKWKMKLKEILLMSLLY